MVRLHITFKIKNVKRLKNISLTILITSGAFLSAFAVTPDLDEVNCQTESTMFGTTQCTDPVSGFRKFCKHTFWITHSCSTDWGVDQPAEEILPE
jgi:hypothetical protein